MKDIEKLFKEIGKLYEELGKKLFALQNKNPILLYKIKTLFKNIDKDLKINQLLFEKGLN